MFLTEHKKHYRTFRAAPYLASNASRGTSLAVPSLAFRQMTMKRIVLLAFVIQCASCDRRPADEPQAERYATLIKAEVTAYEYAAAWDHYDDGSFEAFDSVQFEIAAPVDLAGESLQVLVEPSELPPDSPLRTVGTKCTFEMNLEHLDADQLFWGVLENVRARKP